MKNYLEIIKEVRELQKENYRGEVEITNNFLSRKITSNSFTELINGTLKFEDMTPIKFETIFLLRLV